MSRQQKCRQFRSEQNKIFIVFRFELWMKKWMVCAIMSWRSSWDGVLFFSLHGRLTYMHMFMFLCISCELWHLMLYSGEVQRKHQSSASLAFVRRIHRWLVNSPHQWPVTRKMFPFDDVIMSCSNEGHMTDSTCDPKWPMFIWMVPNPKWLWWLTILSRSGENSFVKLMKTYGRNNLISSNTRTISTYNKPIIINLQVHHKLS